MLNIFLEQARRAARTTAPFDLDRLTEYELWKHLNDVLNACAHKAGTSESPAGCLLMVVMGTALHGPERRLNACAHKAGTSEWRA